MTTKTWEFKQNDVFTKIDKNGQTIMKIPSEIMAIKDWKEGDKVKISIGAQGTIIIEQMVD